MEAHDYTRNIELTQIETGLHPVAPSTEMKELHVHQELCREVPPSCSHTSENIQPLINNLPQETLAEIFAHHDCAYDSFTIPPLEYSEGAWRGCEFVEKFGIMYNGPWRLGQVCRHWREIILGDSTLWNKICIYADPDRVKNSHPTPFFSLRSKHHFNFIVQEGIQRSQTIPLSLNLVISQDETIELILSPMLTTAFRWQDLSITCSRRGGGPTLDELGIFEKVSLSSLNRLELVNIPFEYLSDTNGTIKAPNLQTVIITDIRSPFDIPFPWGQITTLRCYDSSKVPFPAIPFFPDCLAACPKLGTFVGVYRWSYSSVPNLAHIQHSSLITLTIYPPLWLKTVRIRSCGDRRNAYRISIVIT